MHAVIGFINSILWGYVLIYGLLAVGIYFAIRLKLLQFLRFDLFIKAILKSRESDKHGISPFQALCTSLASRVGAGNMAGVAVALYLGGPGAIFWMWVVALLGMGTSYAETVLAQLYKVRQPSGRYTGGPAYYIARGLRAPWLGGAFAVCLIISFGLVFNAVQSNSIAEAMELAFKVPGWAVGVVLAVFAAVILTGGLRSIAKVSEIVVPFMALGYLLAALYVLATHIEEVPDMLALIVSSAFGFKQAAGGAMGYAIGQALLNGVKRGLFSNEAGMGSAPNVAATATPEPHHPASQGFVSGLGPFIDTILVCTATAVMILLSGHLQPGSGLSGIQLTQAAMDTYLGKAGDIFIAVAILFFGFTSILANYSYAENSIYYLKLDRFGGIQVLRVLCLAMVVWGAMSRLEIVWAAADASMGLMATFNLIGVAGLSGVVVKLTRDYLAQQAAGKRPVYDPRRLPSTARGVEWDIWVPRAESAEGLASEEGKP
jgi:AGCS family alanine or glycine:cation symporter